MKTKILSILALLLMTVTQGAWADERTVYDGTQASPLSPAYMNHFDMYTKSQYIIPAANLEAMNGKIITALKYYSTTSNQTSTCNVDVYLKEVGYTTFNSTPTFETKSGIVYTGKLSIASDRTLTITFTTPYTYNGGNLLIGMENTETGNKIYSSFYGQIVTGTLAYGSSSVNREDFIPKTTFTYETPVPPTAVDLGLPSGKKWADRNVGATSETGYGTYFAWAATASQADYSQANAPYYSGSAYTKYTGSDYTMLQRGDDAATVNWGSNWRMPTDTELQELIDNTTKEWKTNYNGTGVNGYLVTSKTNGNSIFLPAAGWYNGTELRSASQGGNYWMSTVVTSDVSCGYSLNFYSTGYAPYKDNTDTRYVGFSIRPVQMFAGEGTEASPYLIASTTDWNNLVSAVNAGETYSGNYFKMTANVDASKMIGSSTETFKGNFDGDGYTLNLNINMTASSSQIAAPFAYVVGGTIKNVKLTGTVNTAGMRSSSLIGYADNCTIRNCTSSVAISSSRNNDVDGGAFVACVIKDKTVTIEGCAFTGSITFSDAAGHEGGGFVGWMRSPSTVTLTDCLFAPSAVSLAKASPAFKMFAYDNAGTTLALNNCYYNGTAACNEKITKQDGTMQMHTITAGDYVSSLSVTKGDATATYTVSGITVYSGGIDFNDGSTTTFYGGSGQNVSLALTAEERSGYQFKQYAASQGTLSDETTDTPTLTMPAANSTANDAVTISAEYDPLYTATFADGNDNNGWTISTSSATAGQTVTISYTGTRTITSVSAVKKPFGLSTFSFATPARGESSNLTFTGASTEKPVWFTGTVDTHNTTGTVVYNHSAGGSYDYLSFNGIQFYAGGWDVPGALYITGGLGTKADPFVLSTTSSPAPDMELTVTSAGEKSWTITMPTSDVEIQVLMPYTVTLADDGSELKEASGGAGVSLPSRSDIGSYTFAGWSTANVTTETTEEPAINAAGEYHPTSDITLYPVYTRTEGSSAQEYTPSVGISAYASANNWGNGTQHSTVTLDANVTATASQGSNTGKYYTNGNDWRIYQSESGSVTISTTSGELSSVTFTFTVANTGTLKYNSSVVTSGTAVSVSGTSANFTVGNSGSATNGQVKITAISVNYTVGSSTTYYTSLPRVSLPYTVTFADGNDNDGWTIDPEQQIEGGIVTVSYTGENKVKSVTVKANPSTLAGLKAAINDASDLTDLNTKVLGKYVTATGDIQSTSEGAVGIIAYISKTAVDNSFADSRIFVIATENASNSAAQAPSNAAETTYNSTSDLNGYAVTNAWQAAGYAASTAGWNYSASRPDGASHWFVPSYGQWVLGGPSSNTISTVMRQVLEGGKGIWYAVSTGRNTDGNDNSYCMDSDWWGMGGVQRISAVRVRAAFVY